LVAPSTVHTLSAPAVAALTHNGVEERTLDIGVREAAGVLSDLAHLGIDLDDVGLFLETESSALALHSLGGVLDRLSAKWGRQ
jgi:transaldolase